MKSKITVGFIGQGWIGKNYADNFEERGFSVVRYSLEEPYIKNKPLLKKCDVVFIAVPTPTTPKGFDSSIVESALKLVAPGKIAVVKSTILPGYTEQFQKKNPKITVLYSPEFLSEATAAHDAAHPFSNIIGISADTARHRAAAKKVIEILPKAPFTQICSSTEAEIIKYTHNASGYFQILFFNLMYDISQKLGSDWNQIFNAIKADPLICNRYAQPVHKSGRGAGGGCFIKDVAALRGHYKKLLPKDKKALKLFLALEEKNIDLLTSTKKDLHFLKGVYGSKIKI